ncbi:MAG: cellulase family glycosylhydrolase [Lachnospiraceae bacterium]
MKKKIISAILIVALAVFAIVVAVVNSGKSTTAGTATNGESQAEGTQTEQDGDRSGNGGDSYVPGDSENDADPPLDENEDGHGNGENTSMGETGSGEFTVSISSDNTWGDAPVYTQLAIVLKNGMDKDINGWKITISVGEDTVIDNGWNGNYSLDDGGALIVTNVDYNAVISAGGTCEIGVILAGITGDLSYTAEAESYQEPGSSWNQGGQNGGQNDGQNNQDGQNGGQNNQQNTTMLEVPEPTTDDWLYVDGNKIVDSEGKQVWLTGVNWFGYNTGTNTFDGLWACDLNTSLQAIANHGFNLLRVPISTELILQWKNGEYPSANFNQATNYYLVGMDSLEIFDYVIGQCRANGIKIMIDIHCAKTDSMGHMANMWYSSEISTEDYQDALVWIAKRYANDDTIIAYDLENEPHGKPYESEKAIWNDSTDKNNWKYVAEQTALKVLEANPNVLIMVEGIEIYPTNIKTNGNYSSTSDNDYYFNWWGGNLRGVADYPLELGKYQNKLVYSPHDYGPAVYQQPWFYDGYDYDSLYEDCWHDNWLYIHEDDTAPLLIGEWGGYMTEPNLTWMTHLRTLISTYKLNHTFWCFNSNSGDTGGLVKDDFTTWDEEKYSFVKEVLWQENGKFVGLDHEIPLGTDGNGITLSEAKGL